MAKALSRKVTIYINGREVENTLSGLRVEMKKLESQQAKLPIGSEEYIQASLKIREIKSVIREQEVAVKGLGDSWKETRTKLADYSNMIMGVQSVFQMIDLGVGKLKDLAKDAAVLDDIYADVMKTTGLTHEQVEKLNESFKKMDTRTSREQLNQLAYEAGKLGINSAEAVTQFVSASDKINIALGDVLGDGAMVTIGKLADVYAKSTKQLSEAGDDLEKKMLAIGSAVNMLGQSSTANEGYLVEFLSRMGGIATQANLSADAILGFASALDQDMMKQEMSATAFQKFIMQMIKKPAEFAKAARMEVNQFTELIQKDMNEALLKVLEGFQGKGGLISLQPIFEDLGLDAARAASVISSMANSIDQIREAQAIANSELTTGSSVINEFNTKNETMQAQAEKAKKRFEEVRIELGNELYPVLIHLQKTGTVFMKWFAALAQVVKNNRWILVSFTTALIALNYAKLKKIATDKLDAIQSRLSNTLTKTGTNLTKLHTATQDRATLASLKLQKAKIALASSNKTVSYTIDGMRISSDKMTAARNIDLAITRQQTVANKSLGVAMKAVPWGWVITAVSALAPLMYKLFTHQSKVNEAEKEAARQYGEAEGKLKVLFGRLEKASEGSKVYAEALSELKREYPELIQQHIDENGKLKDLKKAYEELSEAAKQSVYDRMYADKSSEVYGDVSEALADAMEKSSKYIDGVFGKLSKAERGNIKKLFNDILVEVSKGEKGLAEAYVAMNLVIKESTGLNMTTGYQRWLVKLADKASEAKETLDALSVSLKPTQDPWELDKKSLEQLNAELEAAKRKLAGYDKQIEAGREGFASKAEMERKHVAALEKAIISLKKAQGESVSGDGNNGAGGFSGSSETPEEKKARKARERAEAAWNSFAQSYEAAMSKITSKTLSGVEGISAEVDASLVKMRQDLEDVDQTAHPEAAQWLDYLNQKAEEWKRAKIDEYIAKTNKELDKLAKSAAKTGDGKQIDKVRKATAELEEKLHSIDEAILQLTFDQATLFSKTDEASVRQLHDINEQIAAYKRLRQDMVASVFAEIAPETKRPFKKQEDNRVSLSYQENYTRAITATQAEVGKYTKNLEDALAAEQEMARVARENGNLEEAEKHEKNAEAIQHETENLEELNEEAKKLAKEDAMSKTLNRWAEMMEEFGSKALSIFSNINTTLKNQAQQRLNDLEDEKDDQIKVLDEQFEQGIISEEQYNTRKQELEDNYKAQALEAEKEDWRRQKAYGYSEAVINAAVAATKLWAGEGTTAYKIGMSALLAAEMATQIAAIKSQPEPRAKGGYIHNNQLYRVGERGREWIASNSLLNDPATAPVIEALEAYQRGNRRALADVPMAQLNMPVATAAARELGRRTVGAMENTLLSMPTATQKFNVNMPDSGEMMKLLQDLATYLKDPKNRVAVISRQTMKDFEDNENFLRSKARL